MKHRETAFRAPGRRLNRAVVCLLALLLGQGLLSLLGGCEINQPEMPTFDTSVAVPLGVERLEVMELVEDEDYLLIGEDGSLGFFIDSDPDTVALDLDLTADIDSQTINQGLGEFELADSDPMDYAFELADIWAPAAGLTDQPAVVPAFPIDVASSGQDVPDIESAVLAEGTVQIAVTNNLPVPISADAGPDQVVLELVDPASGTAFATLVFPELAPGDFSIQTADLAGVTLPGQVAVNLSGGSPGSSGNVVNVSGTDSILISAVFADLLVESATALVGAQTFTTDFDTDLPEDYQVTSASISSGAVTLSLSNDMPIPCNATITWPQLHDDLGQDLVESFHLEPGANLDRVIDFSGRLLETDGAPLTTLAAEVVVETPGSGATPVTMGSGDGLTASLSSGSITFGSVTGVVPAYDVALDPMEEEIDLPDEMDGLELTSARLELCVCNSADLPGTLDLVLTGTSASNETRSLAVAARIDAATGRAPRTTVITLDENNSTIVDFLNNLPESITVSGSVQVGGDGSHGTVYGDEYATLYYEISAPVEVVITGTTLTGDPHELDLDEDMRGNIESHAMGANIQTEIYNHMPVGVELSILCGTDLATLETDPLLTIGPLVVAPGLINQLDHTVAEGVISRPVIQLTAEEAQLFAREGLLTIFEVVLPSSNDKPVRMMSTDYLEVRGMVQVDIHVNDEW
jgi:hypothetical protein